MTGTTFVLYSADKAVFSFRTWYFIDNFSWYQTTSFHINVSCQISSSEFYLSAICENFLLLFKQFNFANRIIFFFIQFLNIV